MTWIALALAEAQLRRGAESQLWAVKGKDDLRGVEPRVPVERYEPSFPRQLRISGDLRASLHEVPADVYHAHGLWEMPLHDTVRTARKRGAPYMISPHGMLEAWSLEQSRLKKAVASVLYQRKDLVRCGCLHATAPREVASFRSYGLENPVAVVPNSVEMALFDDLEEHRRGLEERFPQMADRRVVLFLSRIHPKKGIPNLLGAWARLREDFPDWLVVIAGPDEVGHMEEVQAQVDELDLGPDLLFTGPLYGDDKLGALGAADIFCLPSHSEGFSIAILEALASRLPVVITHGCNFPEVARRDAGQVVGANPEEVEAALRTLMEAEPRERRAIGERARRLVAEEYSWDESAAKLLRVYDWLLGGGERPACVEMA
jgi:glycosyltransferase involved in cell wall biosynthesis